MTDRPDSAALLGGQPFGRLSALVEAKQVDRLATEKGVAVISVLVSGDQQVIEEADSMLHGK